jgi:hypothetical protein
LLGFNLTLFSMWVNPEAASATTGQTFMIAVAGSILASCWGHPAGFYIEVASSSATSDCSSSCCRSSAYILFWDRWLWRLLEATSM